MKKTLTYCVIKCFILKQFYILQKSEDYQFQALNFVKRDSYAILKINMKLNIQFLKMYKERSRFYFIRELKPPNKSPRYFGVLCVMIHFPFWNRDRVALSDLYNFVFLFFIIAIILPSSSRNIFIKRCFYESYLSK